MLTKSTERNNIAFFDDLYSSRAAGDLLQYRHEARIQYLKRRKQRLCTAMKGSVSEYWKELWIYPVCRRFRKKILIPTKQNGKLSLKTGGGIPIWPLVLNVPYDRVFGGAENGAVMDKLFSCTTSSTIGVI
jgi:hypothetical protein